jgi:hypothetical protein
MSVLSTILLSIFVLTLNGAECQYAEYHYAECFAECRGALPKACLIKRFKLVINSVA